MTDPSDGSRLETLLVGDITGDFFVASYQRGYRWGEHEVLQLLNDIRESNGATYYLQPVVVKRRDDDSWELIDGQQRLTTLYLIVQYFKREHLPNAGPNYSITYETREGSKEYLERLDEKDKDRNIDFFHMFQAYRCIETWFADFEHRTGFEATRFYGYLFQGVTVLWYEALKEVDSTELFTRLNVGRIPLSDAELVKALLLSHSQGGQGQADRASEMAAYWDSFERDLRSPEVWAFVSGEAESRATNISLLLDTLAGGPLGLERPLFHTFETLRGDIIDDPQGFWRRVVDLHSILLGWYDDRDLFHKVGYLIATGLSFQELIDLSGGKGRSEFEASLDQKVRNHLKISAGELANVTVPGKKTSDVLLLMNVETVRKMKDSSERYSFKAHAASAWTLEHIHAQNAEALTRVAQWEKWLEYQCDALEDLPDLDEGLRADLRGRIKEALSVGLSQQIFRALERELVAVFTPEESDDDEVHSITNLALLGNRDNSALSNSVFEVKRRKIIERDKEGSYIPACTRYVFLKYYTKASEQQLHFWSGTDRQGYLEAIQDTLRVYLWPEDAPS